MRPSSAIFASVCTARRRLERTSAGRAPRIDSNEIVAAAIMRCGTGMETARFNPVPVCEYTQHVFTGGPDEFRKNFLTERSTSTSTSTRETLIMHRPHWQGRTLLNVSDNSVDSESVLKHLTLLLTPSTSPSAAPEDPPLLLMPAPSRVTALLQMLPLWRRRPPYDAARTKAASRSAQ